MSKNSNFKILGNYYPCLVEGCGKKFAVPGKLLTHQKIHRTPEQLEAIEAEKTQRKELAARERNFSCDFPGCGQSFHEEKGLKIHVWKHGRKSLKILNYDPFFNKFFFAELEKPYFCNWEGCDKVYGSRKGMYMHRQTIHYGIRFKCAFCSFACDAAYRLKKHYQQHHDGKFSDFWYRIFLLN